ncbi:MAG: hypothetical protein IJS14_09660 [Lentisphaeria bacterium]|nr:hypothetical protein [Lentisphaeria bacterium]
MKRIFTMLTLGLALSGMGMQLTAADQALPVAGDFQPPKKPGLPPLKWNLLTGSRGTLEYLRDEKGGSIMLTPAPKATLGIYSPAVPAVAGEHIRIEATVYGEKVTVMLMQYAKGASSQTQTVTASKEGKKIVCTFTVKDTPAKGPTKQIRIGFKLKDTPATIAEVKVFKTDEAPKGE